MVKLIGPFNKFSQADYARYAGNAAELFLDDGTRTEGPYSCSIKVPRVITKNYKVDVMVSGDEETGTNYILASIFDDNQKMLSQYAAYELSESDTNKFMSLISKNSSSYDNLMKILSRDPFSRGWFVTF